MNAERWTALLSGSVAEQAITAAVDVAEAIEAFADSSAADKPLRGDRDLSLADGAAGFAVLNAYLALVCNDDRSADRAQRWLRAAIAGLAVRPTTGLYSGAAGVGWAASHVTRLLALDDQAQDSANEIDSLLLSRLENPTWRGKFDLVEGIAGYGVYALERLPAPGARECLERVVDRLGEIAIHTHDGTTWCSEAELLPPNRRSEHPDGHYDVGVAHGVPGVAAVLALSAAAGVARERAAPLAAAAIDWVLAQRLQHTSRSSVLPYFCNVDGSRSVPARTAWCYGDPGAALAILVAARALGVAAWEDAAIELARSAALRAPDASGVSDAWLCHGSAGLAHLFNRMWQATGDEPMRQAARFWLARTFDAREPGGGGFGGYFAKRLSDGDGSGLLTGATGVALTLLAAATAVPPSWDRVLLASPI